MFEVNDKVVCVDASPGLWDGQILVKDAIYIVCGIDPTPDCNRDIGLFITGHPVKTGPKRSWRSTRFRKLQDIKAENALKKSKLVTV